MRGHAIQLPIRRSLALALLSGVATALSLPPWGWWPLAFVGLAVLYRVVEDAPWRRRILLGWVAGLGHFGIGLYWMLEFTLPGGILASLFSALFVAAVAVITPPDPGWRRAAAFPAALLLLEAVRIRWPFGGVPPGGLPLGQIAGPLGAAARVGGPLVLVALAALAAVALAERGVWRRIVPAIVVIVVATLGVVAPDGEPTGERVDTALVQGGGRRGFRASESDESAVYARHVATTTGVRTGVDLIVWPENVVHVDETIASTPEGDELAGLARLHRATLVAGVVEGEGTNRFHNAAVAWAPDGRLIGRYEKVHRVPFGEWVPYRSLVDRIAPLDDVPADAIVGRGPNVITTPVGRLGLAISYEVFFADRGRAATKRRAGALLVPTNAASFSTSQMPTQELAAAQLLAVSAGRTVLQAAPTGYTAVVTPDGRVRARSVLGRREVLHARVSLRRGRTLYARTGDWPWLALSLAAILTARSSGGKKRLASSA